MSRKSLVLVSLCFLGLVVLAFSVGRRSALREAERNAAAMRAAAGPAETANDAKVAASAEPARLIVTRSQRSAEFAQKVGKPVTSLAAEEERQRLIEQWAEIDPAAALDFARTQLTGDRQAQALSSVIAIWGKNDPAAAWSWVTKEMPNATHHFDTLLEVFGKNSTELAARYAAQFALTHPEAATEVNLAALMGVTYRGDFTGALDFIRTNAALDAPLRGTLNNFLAGQWARVSPTEAAAWVMKLPEGPERAQALIGLGESWSEVDPAGAAAFAATLPEGESRTLAMRQAVAKWVMSAPQAAREWVMKTNQTQDFDSALEAIATQNNFMSREPAHAMVWATGIFDEKLRSKTMNTVLFNWSMIDRQSATAYLMSSPEFTPEQKAELLKKMQPTQG